MLFAKPESGPKMSDRLTETDIAIIAFRAPADLAAAADQAAAAEGISRSDVARRALIRDLAQAKQSKSGAVA
jgi:hypothetical protein